MGFTVLEFGITVGVGVADLKGKMDMAYNAPQVPQNPFSNFQFHSCHCYEVKFWELVSGVGVGIGVES